MTSKERKVLEEVILTLENDFLYRNKNLTQKQYYAVDDCIEKLKTMKKGHKNELV